MKKNRPGAMLRVIAKPEKREELAGYDVRGDIHAGAADLYGRTAGAGARVGRGGDAVRNGAGEGRRRRVFAPEYEDCRRLASATGVPLKQVIAEANQPT